MIFCPDCETEVADDEFVAHRERAHPPTTQVITIPDAIHSGERMGWED